jgi:hypothetical protein
MAILVQCRIMHRIGSASSGLFQAINQTLPCGDSLKHANLSQEAGLVWLFTDVLSTADIKRMEGDKKCIRFELFTEVKFLSVGF